MLAEDLLLSELEREDVLESLDLLPLSSNRPSVLAIAMTIKEYPKTKDFALKSENISEHSIRRVLKSMKP